MIKRLTLPAESIVLHIVLKRRFTYGDLAVLKVKERADLHCLYIISAICENHDLILIHFTRMHLEEVRRPGFRHQGVDGIAKAGKKQYGQPDQHRRDRHKYAGRRGNQFIRLQIVHYHSSVHLFPPSRSLTSLNWYEAIATAVSITPEIMITTAAPRPTPVLLTAAT